MAHGLDQQLGVAGERRLDREALDEHVGHVEGGQRRGQLADAGRVQAQSRST